MYESPVENESALFITDLLGIEAIFKTSWAIIRPPGPVPFPSPAKFDKSRFLEEARVFAKGLANIRVLESWLANWGWVWGWKKGCWIVTGSKEGWWIDFGVGEASNGSGCDAFDSEDSKAVKSLKAAISFSFSTIIHSN